MVEEGSFRLDLYHRIRTQPFWIPALRDRKEDIPLLINHLLKGISKNYENIGLQSLRCDEGFLELAKRHSGRETFESSKS